MMMQGREALGTSLMCSGGKGRHGAMPSLSKYIIIFRGYPRSGDDLLLANRMPAVMSARSASGDLLTRQLLDLSYAMAAMGRDCAIEANRLLDSSQRTREHKI